MAIRHLMLGFLLPALAGLVPLPSAASSLAVAPTRLDFSSDRPAVAFTVRNAGDAPVDLQIRAMRWTNTNPDELAPTDSLVLSPPRALIAAGATQTVRVYRRLPPASTEQAFRVVLDEIPATDAASVGPVVLKLPLRILLPAFIPPTETCAPKLEASAVRGSDGPRLRLTNPSACHTRLTAFGAAAGVHAKLSQQEGLAYVLPQTSIELPLPASPSGVWSVRADTDSGVFESEVRLAPSP